MRLLALFAAFASFAPALAWAASQHPVTILVQYDHPASAASYKAMEHQVRHLLSGMVDVRFENGTAPVLVEGRLVTVHMRGYCTMNAPAADSPRGLPLAFTEVSDGVVLPFSTVECDRIRGSLETVTGTLNANRHQAELGAAIGSVVVHELYHILNGSEKHTTAGVTKPELSPLELVSNIGSVPQHSFDSDDADTQRIR